MNTFKVSKFNYYYPSQITKFLKCLKYIHIAGNKDSDGLLNIGNKKKNPRSYVILLERNERGIKEMTNLEQKR